MGSSGAFKMRGNKQLSWDVCTNEEKNDILIAKYAKLLDDLAYDD